MNVGEDRHGARRPSERTLHDHYSARAPGRPTDGNRLIHGKFRFSIDRAREHQGLLRCTHAFLRTDNDIPYKLLINLTILVFQFLSPDNRQGRWF